MNNTIFWQATMMTRAGAFREGLALFKHLLKTRPDYQEALLGASYCAMRLGHLDDAKQLLEDLNHPLKERLVMRYVKEGRV